jgi:alpha-beta hydrolase superfamily lysophospholipase
MFTVKAYADMFDGLKMLYPEKLDAISKTMPVYMLSGDHDPVGGNGAGVRKVHDELKAAGVKDLTLRLYEGGRHEMFNEVNREEVWAELVAWLDSKL